MSNAEHTIGLASTAKGRLHTLIRNCEDLATTPPTEIQRIGALLQEMILNYYSDVRKQAQQSFLWALIAAGVGTALFFAAAIFQGTSRSQTTGLTPGTIGLIGGALVQLISGVQFFLYGRAARQFATFHVCLERTNRFLLANSLCENLTTPELRDAVRTELVRIVANAPMLVIDCPDAPSGDASITETPRPPSAPLGPS